MKPHDTPKARRRRILTARHKERLLRKSKESRGWLGPYFDEDKNRLIIIPRGKRSKFLKKCGNRRVRNSKELLKHSNYKRVYDYWWELT